VALLRSAGPIGAALRRDTAESIAAGLVDFGLPSAEAGRYADHIQAGQILLSVQSSNSDTSDRARELFTAAQAADIFTIVQVTTPRVWPSRAHDSIRHSYPSLSNNPSAGFQS
jgi:hypothetical protein